jgi:cyclophilin family peptidyl-prolyl cis-trans isomerase
VRLSYTLVAAAVAGCAVAGGCARRASITNPADKRFVAAAPDSFDVEMVTTKGALVVRVRRDWSPNGADRFHALVRHGFFTNVAFHRTIRNFVAQFGIHGDSLINAVWSGKTIADDEVRAKNERGTLAFARGGANTRSTQLFVNLVDNTPRLDTLNGFGFPPIGRIIEGLSVIDSLNWEYSGTRGVQPTPQGPRQDSLRLQGNSYLYRSFPRLDYIVRARVVRNWRD